MLETASALQNESHPLHEIAVEYTEGLRKLREQFPDGKIKFIRPGYPKKSKGVDSRGRQVTMLEPKTPALFPLRREVVNEKRGTEIWSCCLTAPKLLPNNLWEIDGKRSIKIDEFVIVNLNKQPDLAYYLAFIAKFKSSLLKVDDPEAEVRERAAEERRLVELKSAIWQMLPDEEQLRKVSAAYGVTGAHTMANGRYTKSADRLRIELEEQIKINETRRGKHKDFTAKGVREFLEEMKVTDSVRLRAFVQRLIDEKKLTYKPDGRFRLGDKAITQVPHSEIGRKFEWLCSYFAMPSNKDRLQELMRDVVDKEYLDSITEDKDYAWLCKVMDVTVSFKKKEEIKSTVYGVFNIAP